MPSSWRYALNPIPVAADAKKLALTMTAPARLETLRRERQPTSVVDVSAEKTTRRIVRGLRARVTEPELHEQDGGPDDDPSSRN